MSNFFLSYFIMVLNVIFVVLLFFRDLGLCVNLWFCLGYIMILVLLSRVMIFLYFCIGELGLRFLVIIMREDLMFWICFGCKLICVL